MSWQDELKNPIKSDENYKGAYPIFIPRGYAMNEVLKKQFLPNALEDNEQIQSEGYLDPIGDEKNHVAPQLIHRYENRVLFMPTDICPINCRYCFRKNELHTKNKLFNKDFEKTLLYIKEHTEIEEVIFTGGDPLILTDDKIESYLEQFAQIEHLKVIRFHTRTPIILPSRITKSFAIMLEGFQQRFKIIIAIHTNHADELNSLVKAALGRLSKLEMLSQTVLLKGVNDKAEVLEKLFKQLTQLNIRPYYLHHPDKVRGAMHFYLSQTEGSKIYQKLRKKLSGWALPHYIVDNPEGSGKGPAFKDEH